MPACFAELDLLNMKLLAPQLASHFERALASLSSFGNIMDLNAGVFEMGLSLTPMLYEVLARESHANPIPDS